MLLYPKEVLENKVFRAKLLIEAQGNVSLQQQLIQKCKEDILFLFNVFFWTYDPRLTESDIPFITYPFQDEFILTVVRNIERGQDTSIEKSRAMGFSWMMAGIMIQRFMCGESSLYGSYKEDYVDEKGNMDSHFERMRYIIEHCPPWLFPKDIQSKYMGISSKALGAEISGDSGSNFGTGGRRKFVVMDEFQVWQDDRKAFRKTKDVTPCRILGGTPEGKFNVYGKLMTGDEEYKHLNIHKITLHWSLHPLKTKEWYENEKQNRTKLDVAKELDISYEDSVTGAVYPNFSTIVQFGEYEYNPNLPLFTSWDFGRDMVSIIWVQKDVMSGKYYVIDAFQKSDCDIDFFFSFITGSVNDKFSYTEEELDIIATHAVWVKSYARHFGDPYNGNSRNVLSTNTIKKEFTKVLLELSLKSGTTLEDRITKTSLHLRHLCVDKRLTPYINAMVQSRYPEVKDTSQATTEKTKPIHNIFSHYRTATEYFFDNDSNLEIQKEPLQYNKKSGTNKIEKQLDSEELFPTKTNKAFTISYK